jgi:hypothetical protein
LHSGDKAFVYCIYDSDKLKSELRLCPYIIELAFSTLYDKPDGNRLLEMFERQHIHVQAFYVDKCPVSHPIEDFVIVLYAFYYQNLLEFQIPNEPMYHKHRVFIRLQHKSSLDYNPSPPALVEDECWIYYADTNLVVDGQLNRFFLLRILLYHSLS